jgi:hypothetical protein
LLSKLPGQYFSDGFQLQLMDEQLDKQQLKQARQRENLERLELAKQKAMKDLCCALSILLDLFYLLLSRTCKQAYAKH